MTEDINVTSFVEFNNADDECLPLTKCVCGYRFEPWTTIISIYRDTPWECPICRAKLYCSLNVQVFQIVSDQGE